MLALSAELEGWPDSSQQSLPALGPTLLCTSASVSPIFACIDRARLDTDTAGEILNSSMHTQHHLRAGGAAGR